MVYVVHDRIGVQGHSVPINPETIMDIPEEFFEDLDILQRNAEELNQARLELGRLMQVVNNLIYTCNNRERNMADAKKQLIEQMGITEGNWAIDFENKQVGRVLPPEGRVPTVV